jgi:GNAT superfamily N-acetyltransferase
VLLLCGLTSASVSLSLPVRGGGVLLYRAFEAWAKTKKATELRMGYLVDLMPEKVAHFYERVGFERVEVGYSKRLLCAG